jgi:hypothetical protein
MIKVLVIIALSLLIIAVVLFIFFVLCAVNAVKYYKNKPAQYEPEESLHFWHCGLCNKSLRFKELSDITDHLHTEHPDSLFIGHHIVDNTKDECFVVKNCINEAISNYKPIVKFNNGRGALLCKKCRVIIKENLTEEESKGNTPLTHCKKCKPELYDNHLGLIDDLTLKKVRLSKILERDDAEVPGNIKVGEERIGYMIDVPEENHWFLLYDKLGLPRFHTSLVKEILSFSHQEIVFKTLNSVYQLEYLSDPESN